MVKRRYFPLWVVLVLEIAPEGARIKIIMELSYGSQGT
jgi:hypothetical protein